MRIGMASAVLLTAFALAACIENETASISSESTGTGETATTAEPAEPAAAENTASAESTVEKEVATNGLCLDAGPQTPRDISNKAGSNPVTFAVAPPSTEMNLCNIHTHTNAEHKGPGFSVFVNDTDSGGYACNETASLTEEELAVPTDGGAHYKGVMPGDTIEVHWVHSSCDITPGEGLGTCLNDACSDPVLRVEAQTFLVVNDPNALDFNDFDYAGSAVDGRHQPKAIPNNTGTPIQFLGSTTGPSYTQQTCSPAKVTWNVRPNCAKVDISSLHEWAAKGNVFNETKSHGVRQLVTAEELLSQIN